MSIFTSSTIPESETADPRQLIQIWRTRLLNGILIAAIILGLPAVLTGSIAQYEQGGMAAWPLLLMNAIAYIAMVVMALFRRIGYIARALTLLSLMAGIGGVTLVTDGLPGDGRIFLFGFVVMAAALFGIRGGIAALTTSLLILGIVAFLYIQGQLALSPHQLASIDVVPTWVRSLVLLLVLGGLSVISFVYLFRQLTGLANRATGSAHSAATSARIAAERAAVLEAQSERLQQTETMLRELVSTLETPTVSLAEGVVLAPIVGRIDSARADMLLRRLLAAVSDGHIRLMVIDVSGVPVVDTQVAQGLIQVAQALRLLGCRAALTGITPEVAATLAGLEIAFDDLLIAHSPHEILTQLSRDADEPDPYSTL